MGKNLSPATTLATGAKQNQSMLSTMISSDMVPVSDVVSYSAIVQLLAQADHPFRTQAPRLPPLSRCSMDRSS